MPVDFSYGLGFALASVFPPLAVGLWRAHEEQVLRLCLVSMASLVTLSLLGFYGTGMAGCDDLGFGPGQDEHFILLSLGTLLVPMIAGAVAESRVRIDKLSLTVALLISATSSFLLFLHVGHCLPSSQKVIREAYALFFLPYILLLGIACTALGAAIKRRLARVETKQREDDRR